MPTSDDLTGHVIAGKYELVRLIRHGMGAVYEARQTSSGERCAVKLLSAEMSGDAEVVRRFFIEARAMTTVRSEHVVSTFDSGIDDSKRPFYAMEYLTGEDLAETLKRLGSLNQVAATKILLQAATGLAKAHAHGIIHRDVKPSNLFLARTGDGEVKVKVLDFGIAKVKMELFSETFSSVTRTGSLLGTPFYMSPEQVKRANSIDSSADVWSLGVVLWECLTGKLPWGPAESFGELIAAVLTADIGSVQDHAPWVRPDLAEILRRTLCREIGTRLSSAVPLLDELRVVVLDDGRLTEREITAPAEAERASLAPRLSFADTVAASASPVVRSVAATPPARPSERGWRLALALGAAAALVLALVVFVPDGEPESHARPEPTVVTPVKQAAAPAPSLALEVRAPPEERPSGVTATVDAGAVPARLDVPGSRPVASERARARPIKAPRAPQGPTATPLSAPAPAPQTNTHASGPTLSKEFE